MIERPDAPATGRNRDAILEVLERELDLPCTVLEIGSGTGQHAVYFAQKLPGVTWQTSDRAQNLDGIRAWVASAELDRLLPPLELDVLTSALPETSYDCIFSANTAHIMGMPAVRKMFAIVAACRKQSGVFCLYGPFNEDDKFTSASNEDFDRSLKAQDSAMGLRNIETLDEIARDHGLERVRTYAMPANNQLAVWAGIT